MGIEEKIDEALKEVIKANLEEQDPTSNQFEQEEGLLDFFVRITKELLWSLTNHLIYYSVFSKESMAEKKGKLQDTSFCWLIFMAFSC
jgi:hypothetical protein